MARPPMSAGCISFEGRGSAWLELIFGPGLQAPRRPGAGAIGPTSCHRGACRPGRNPPRRAIAGPAACRRRPCPSARAAPLARGCISLHVTASSPGRGPPRRHDAGPGQARAPTQRQRGASPPANCPADWQRRACGRSRRSTAAPRSRPPEKKRGRAGARREAAVARPESGPARSPGMTGRRPPGTASAARRCCCSGLPPPHRWPTDAAGATSGGHRCRCRGPRNRIGGPPMRPGRLTLAATARIAGKARPGKERLSPGTALATLPSKERHP
jgi:hypothetical protein